MDRAVDASAEVVPPAGAVGRGYWLTRALFLRALAGVYLVAFVSLSLQVLPLFGQDGILPVRTFLQWVRTAGDPSFFGLPSLFLWGDSDRVLLLGSYAGSVLALLALFGVAHGAVYFLLWLLYLSYVNVGQVFYGYGWESLLLESGFLAIFFAPWRNVSLWSSSAPPWPWLPVLLRWVLFRVMFGAGMIKLRSADPCWRELTCLLYHYETQPLPNPASWYFHHLPRHAHMLGALFNHFVELIVPWLLFGPRRVRAFAGCCIIVFQTILILSGNLSWLNYLTIALCIACFDDGQLSWLLAAVGRQMRRPLLPPAQPTPGARGAQYTLVAVIALLSLGPTFNLLSPGQLMNASFEPFQIVNTYGAFGTVGRERFEVILEGTSGDPNGEATWLPYEFLCKPGRPDRRPCLVSPFQPRLDWQIWFAAMEQIRENPWLLSLVEKLLEGNKAVLFLLETNPFPDAPPRWIRGELYRYRFTDIGDRSGAWWVRERAGVYFPPLSLEMLRPANSQ